MSAGECIWELSLRCLSCDRFLNGIIAARIFFVPVKWFDACSVLQGHVATV